MGSALRNGMKCGETLSDDAIDFKWTVNEIDGLVNNNKKCN